MTITLQAVNELIKSLESAGELSIKETKVMALARAYQQLSAENVGLKGALTGSAYISFIKANGWNTSASTVNGKFVNFADPEVDFGSMVFAHAKKLIEAVETPATDRIVAEAEARGVEKFAAEQRGVAERLKKRGGDVVMSSIKFCLESAEEAEVFAQQLREGAK
ncbi:hypothetical protein FMK59_14460 [Klebsiella michiganensis]|jgi:hypothetical protein|uniref:hypothetical protein n=1 Tax=Klebsiella michiganensis TaxID=1134687 RepID=UPI001CCF50E6|nr:hypothetical protein [Klebsiella michiganensis]MBZ7186869.1 hypothetical protein [Klebsiella michiganensis]